MRSFTRILPRWMTRENSASVNFILATAIWAVLGTTMGLILALEFPLPDLFEGVPYLTFSRLRQAHVNAVIFGFVSNGMIGLFFYLIPQLSGRRLWSEFLGNVDLLIWNGSVAVGVGGILLGFSQGREYSEFIYGVDVGVVVALIILAIDIWVTIAHRVERHLFVSEWYIGATVILFPIVYFVGNVMWNPPTGAYRGINDVVFNWFYGHNVLGMWLTLGVIPFIYYIISKVTDTPVYSHVVGLIGFWTIILFYNGLGGHHLEWAPIAPFVKNLAIAFSIGMIIPVNAVLVNWLFTLRNNWSKVFGSIPLIYIVVSGIAYILVSFQGIHQALRVFNLLSHFTQYVPGHAHLGILFFSAVGVMGTIYYVLPRICHCELWSRRWAWVQWSLLIVGFFFFFFSFVLTGMVQGSVWFEMGIQMVPALPGFRPFLALRPAAGALLYANFLLFFVQVFLTWLHHFPAHEPVMPYMVHKPILTSPTGIHE
jgi:cbb3-type cytochrome c oxidase subunit I